MVFKPPFNIGEIVSNAELSKVFKVGNMGGMRRSKATGTLVIISDETKSFYKDNWHNDTLLYTGMGKTGNQDINFKQNKTLNESRVNGIELHLFVVHNANQYTYKGVVELCDEPYEDTQEDENGNKRTVWIFPLKLVTK